MNRLQLTCRRGKRSLSEPQSGLSLYLSAHPPPPHKYCLNHLKIFQLSYQVRQGPVPLDRRGLPGAGGVGPPAGPLPGGGAGGAPGGRGLSRGLLSEGVSDVWMEKVEITRILSQ